jgi:peptide/nickel transport system permease protein
MSTANPTTKVNNNQVNAMAEDSKFESRLQVIWRRYKKNKLAVVGLVIFSFFLLVAIFAPLITPYDPLELDIINSDLAPSWEHPFGTDSDGGDVLSRTIQGARVSLMIGIVAMVISVTIGVIYGAVSGFFGGVVDNIMMRIVDAISSIPSLFLLLIIATIMVPSVWTTIFVISLVGWAGMSRIVRGEILSLKRRDYVEAARATGEKRSSIIFYHIIPNAIAPIIVIATLDIAGNILLETGLSFLGLGVQPPTPSWGNMLTAAQELSTLLYHPWIAIFPGLCIVLTVLSVMVIGDGLRDALDPRMKQ